MEEKKVILYDEFHEHFDYEERYCKLLQDSSGEKLLMYVVDADRKP